ncbi:MAG: hypothetical protein WEC99_02035 [Halofilum sp. (in: g-proteobacteria)]
MAGRRRIMLILALVLAVTVGVGWDACRPEPPPPGERLLSYVPADTAFFAGMTQAASTPQVGAGSGFYRYLLGRVGTDASAVSAAHGPAAGIVAALLQAQRAAVERGARPFSIHGLPVDAVVAAYTVGQSPVLRWELAEPRRFWRAVDEAERRAGASAPTEWRESHALRRYPLDVPGASLQLVLATGEDFALVALHAPGDERADLDEILGEERPAEPIDRALLDDLTRSYGLVPGSASFVDNERLFTPLADDPSASLLGRVGRIVGAAEIRLHPWLAALGTAGCRELLELLPEFWARTVVGMTGSQPAVGRVDHRIVFESPHQRGLAAIETLEGRIPALAQAPETVLGFGIGLDVSEWMTREPGNEPAGDKQRQSEADATRSECSPIAALQAPGDARGNAPALQRLLVEAEGAGLSVFRVPPEGGRGRRPGVASAVMLSTSEPAQARAALWEIAGLDRRPAVRGPGSGPWQSIRRSSDEAPGDGLLLSEAPLVLAQPPAGTDEAAAAHALVAFRYRHGLDARAVMSALDPWLAPLAERQREALRNGVAVLQRLPFDLDVEVRVGERGVEFDLAIAPAQPGAVRR